MDNASFQLSFDLRKAPSPHVSIMEINQDNLPSQPLNSQLKGFNQSLDIWNILKKQERCQKQDCFNSKQLFSSIPLQNQYSKLSDPNIKQSDFLVNDYQKNKTKIENKGNKPLSIVMVESEEEFLDEQMQLPLVPIVKQQEQQPLRKSLQAQIRKFLPPNVQIPTQYLKGLINIHNQPQTKSIRRLKVERYLEKRRLKTWNKKICYNCRQKVAQERLRIKGRFVARKKPLPYIKIEKVEPKIQQNVNN